MVKRSADSPRVLHGPVNVGSQASALARAENAVRAAAGDAGRSWSVDFEPNAIVSQSDHVIPSRLSKRAPSVVRKGYRIFRPLWYGLRHQRQFDILHLYFRKTLLGYTGSRVSLAHLDLPLWRGLGKRIFATFQGCDARMKTVCSREPVSACADGRCAVASCTARLDERRRASIAHFARYADKLFCLNPDLVQFVPGAEFLPYVNLEPALLEISKRRATGQPLVVHAPSNRSIKGTELLLEASDKLMTSHPHRLQLVEGVPRAQALDLYAGADILVDQLLIGWYGGLAVEAMALGLPVVAYLNPRYLEWLPTGMRDELPIVSASPDDVSDVLARLLEDESRREELGRRGRRYVERWHHPLKIARRMLALYRDPSLGFWDDYDPD